ncbi:hypothetical protein RRG08_048813 [Elysia crispata]|uniref:Ubiquitin-like domain-containing protein n=1 Tax=Elysia crispata TaxID=231223 RepID=A0AAE1E9K2_9GAST|nr:hypothetical protein RRG08_048813 [Elysia crispata]
MATNGTEVYIKLPTGRSSRYDIYPSQVIRTLCERVAQEENVKANQVSLKYQGKILDPSKTVSHYGVRVETILKAEILVPQNLDIIIRMEDGEKTEEMVISNLEPVSYLFEKISGKFDIPSSRLQIKIEGRNLQFSGTRLVDAGIARGSIVVVCKKPELTAAATVNGASEESQMDEATRQNVLSSFNAKGKRVEVAFSFDTTGSMYGYLREVRQKLRQCCTRLLQDIPNIRISIIAQGDYCDSESQYAVRILDLTSDVQSLVDFANNVPATSGGDSPECYELVLKKTQELDWSEDSAKALVVIGDLHPHPPSYTDQHISWRDELDVLTGLGVKVYGVQAGNSGPSGLFYRELSRVSGGCHLKLSDMDVITDMFLAVCYNVGEGDMLENFEKELEETGNMTNQKLKMFQQLKEMPESRPSDSVSHRQNNTQREQLREPWWDFSLDTQTSPKYCYKADEDKWLPPSVVSTTLSAASLSLNVVSRKTSSSIRRIKGKDKCTIM